MSIICLFLFIGTSAFSQDRPSKPPENDKLATKHVDKKAVVRQTKAYVSQGFYNKADQYLSEYYERFEDDLEINWLYAHTLWLNKNTKKADSKFRKARSIAPDNRELQMDYARFLFNQGEIYRTEKMLNLFVTDRTTNAEFLMMQAKISYWKGDLKKSKRLISRINELYPNAKQVTSLEKDIEALTAAYAKINVEYQTDSQPLEFIKNQIEIGKYVSRFLHPKIKISRWGLTPENHNAITFRLSNEVYFQRLKLSAEISGGIYANSSATSDWIGGLKFEKEIFKNASLTFGYNKDALIGTIASTRINLTKQDAYTALDFKNKYVVLNASVNRAIFEDGNFINTLAGWILSNPLKLYKFNFQVGYGYNFTDSDQILFFYDNNGAGIYDPYFTPREQEIHSGLFVMNFKPNEKLTFQAQANYGFKATVQNPYPVPTANSTFEIGGFYNAPFDHMEINGSLNYQLNDKFNINATYIHQETFFYDRQNINLGLNFIF